MNDCDANQAVIYLRKFAPRVLMCTRLELGNDLVDQSRLTLARTRGNRQHIGRLSCRPPSIRGPWSRNLCKPVPVCKWTPDVLPPRRSSCMYRQMRARKTGEQIFGNQDSTRRARSHLELCTSVFDGQRASMHAVISSCLDQPARHPDYGDAKDAATTSGLTCCAVRAPSALVQDVSSGLFEAPLTGTRETCQFGERLRVITASCRAARACVATVHPYLRADREVGVDYLLPRRCSCCSAHRSDCERGRSCPLRDVRIGFARANCLQRSVWIPAREGANKPCEREGRFWRRPNAACSGVQPLHLQMHPDSMRRWSAGVGA
ncbi:hypothetical protein CERSUDRAFT_103385 [Gelatoporia subvermispora B]|uniref:Uncharacterized protein n=1 Tax=Ceriporiopsis subvermispora (strain B) TaxID=914234 RepID=M2QVB0_CERS8|nr:hypothetical protein CERSUDRAFT_103385 [Gelatoporia subvermispora B]